MQAPADLAAWPMCAPCACNPLAPAVATETRSVHTPSESEQRSPLRGSARSHDKTRNVHLAPQCCSIDTSRNRQRWFSQSAEHRQAGLCLADSNAPADVSTPELHD